MYKCLYKHKKSTTMSFLGGVHLVNGIQIAAFKNSQQHWLSIIKNGCFADFVDYGDEISGLTASPDGLWFAYFQKNVEKGVLEFVVWKYKQLSETEHEIEPYTELYVPIDWAFAQACFNSAGTHVACLSEWNHIYIVDLRRLDAPTEFYIPNGCDEVRPQVVYDAGNHFIWFGQDEFVRIIDLTSNDPTMWRDKLTFGGKKTKYMFVRNNHIVHMSDDGVIVICKAKLLEKRLEIFYDNKYPTGKYEDITIDEYGNIKIHKKSGKHFVIDL